MITPGIAINRIGKYLYKNLDGAYKFKKSPNTYDLYITLLYQHKLNDDDVHEMTLNLNITTYLNKLRVNIIELTPEERTIGHDVYLPEVIEDLPFAKELIMNKVRKRIQLVYRNYNILF